MTSDQKLNTVAWAISTIVMVLAVYVWGHGLGWHFSGLSIYQLFPVFGLVAFSVMWSHYVVSVLRQILGLKKEVLRQYIEVTSLIVLIAIFMHPGLLWFQLFRDGFGLPPSSYLQHYVVPGLRYAALIGTVSWFVFLTYELRRKYDSKSWWKFVGFATDLAMLGIVVHSLKLGGNLQTGWFRIVWYFYAITLVASLAYIYNKKLAHRA